MALGTKRAASMHEILVTLASVVILITIILVYVSKDLWQSFIPFELDARLFWILIPFAVLFFFHDCWFVPYHITRNMKADLGTDLIQLEKQIRFRIFLPPMLCPLPAISLLASVIIHKSIVEMDDLGHPVFPIFTVLMLAGIPLLVISLILWRVVRRNLLMKIHRMQICRKCNYDLRGCPTSACPECGYDIKPDLAKLCPEFNLNLHHASPPASSPSQPD